MGKPNYPCFENTDPYREYSDPVTTTTSTSTTIAPEDIDFFVIPDSGALCPKPVTTFQDEDRESCPGIDDKLLLVCNSISYNPNPCIREVNKYIKVADVSINVDDCARYKVILKDLSFPTTTTTTTTTTLAPTTTTTTLSPIVGGNSANYGWYANWNGTTFGNVTTVGSNGGPSAYGTYDQSGNVFEWNDLGGTISSVRGFRGGSWSNGSMSLSTQMSATIHPEFESTDFVWTTKADEIGFRLASSLNPLFLNLVLVGDANNNADLTEYGSHGSVSTAYYIGKYPVTNCEYAAFLNAVASTDTYTLYNTNMSSRVAGGITRSGTSGSYSYSVKTNMGNKPVVLVSWFDCARYCNWLHNRVNDPNSTETETGAYTLNGVTTGNAVAKNNNASYSIPTQNQWYKAAYYKGGGGNAGYWLYATQSNTAPTPVTASSTGDGLLNGVPARVTDYICPNS